MAIDDIKIECFSKALCVGVVSIYLAWQMSVTLRAPPGTGNADALAKAHLIRPSCLLVLGGSNARNGFSAAQLSTPGCPALNLAVSSELGGFDRYMAWLGGRARADTVIYSTLLIVSPSSEGDGSDDGVLGVIDHVTPLAGRLRVMLLGQADLPSSEFTPSGDQLHYVCDSTFRGQYLEFSNLERGTPEVLEELARRVAVIHRVTGARRVVLHTPRLYVDAQLLRSAETRFLKTLGQRLAAIRIAGLAVLDTPVVNSDRSLFCDERHASAKGRDAISWQVRAALSQP
jgi:hypothetical protein